MREYNFFFSSKIDIKNSFFDGIKICKNFIAKILFQSDW
jgi:hypothetical protein